MKPGDGPFSARPRRVEPLPGQESVWDYPRPPAVERVRKSLRVEFAKTVVAETAYGLRVIETASPPVYYFPSDDVRTELLEPSPVRTICEWKGVARYWNVRIDERVAEDAAWSYPNPEPEYEAIADYYAFYARKMDACYVGSMRALPQEGEFYGGWITSDLAGPFKGGPGTEEW
ncbi:MAG: DUF427 domain-containing protein [Gemmatimonadetes bacterium]|nr:DUF427 domain-containing protein [Gemmatimonadota bacterium]